MAVKSRNRKQDMSSPAPDSMSASDPIAPEYINARDRLLADVRALVGGARLDGPMLIPRENIAFFEQYGIA
jgi:hypothetical protein